MMNAGGYRVSPLEVEAALLAHPDITDVGATTVQVKQDASVIGAFYVADQALDEGTLMTFAAASLARYKQPRLYRRVASMPRNANGKLMRRRLPDLPPL